jgi:hypothetical protein
MQLRLRKMRVVIRLMNLVFCVIKLRATYRMHPERDVAAKRSVS